MLSRNFFLLNSRKKGSSSKLVLGRTSTVIMLLAVKKLTLPSHDTVHLHKNVLIKSLAVPSLLVFFFTRECLS
jgi:hypothetical protein